MRIVFIFVLERCKFFLFKFTANIFFTNLIRIYRIILLHFQVKFLETAETYVKECLFPIQRYKYTEIDYFRLIYLSPLRYK